MAQHDARDRTVRRRPKLPSRLSLRSAVCEEMRQPSPFAQFPFAAGLRLLVKGLASGLLILLAIAFIAAWGLILADYGRQHLPAQALSTAWQALQTTAKYIFAHPQTYYWARADVPWLNLVGGTLLKSAGLLILSMSAALVLGLPLGTCGRNGIPQGSFRCRRGALRTGGIHAQFSARNDALGGQRMGASDLRYPGAAFHWLRLGRAPDHAGRCASDATFCTDRADHLRYAARSTAARLCSDRLCKGPHVGISAQRAPAT